MLVTEVDGEDVVVRYADPDHVATHVSVWAHLHLGDTSMHQVEGGWEVRVTGLPVDRFEYLLDVDGDLRPDPSNPRVTGGPFGDHSWIPLPAYREPAWLGLETCPGDRATLMLSRTGAGRFDSEIWSPVDTSVTDPLPLLLSHDGPEMDAYGGLTAYVAALVAAGTLPPMRVAMVAPGPRRNKRYAANPAYARALTSRLVPALTDAVATEGRPVLIGQSLGALAALHATWTSPTTFGGLFLQSGSFFTPAARPPGVGVRALARGDRVRGQRARVEAGGTGCATDHADLRHGRGEPRQQRRDARPPCGRRRRDGLGRGQGRAHLDLLARHPRPSSD